MWVNKQNRQNDDSDKDWQIDRYTTITVELSASSTSASLSNLA